MPARRNMKRRRHEVDDESSEDEEVERSSPSKRACHAPERGALSLAVRQQERDTVVAHQPHKHILGRNGGDGFSDQSEEEGAAREEAERGANAANFITMDEEDEEREQLEDGLVAGTIKTVVLQNFLNHRHFKVDLIRDINFFTGQNGSGKSAVLTAIVVCLGSSTRFTSRGARLVDFICKTNNATYCKISVTLANVGPDAYHPEQYGNSITVERTISKTPAGTAQSQFALKDHAGHIVSKKKGDMGDMLETFSWRVNNPCTILMQETAKEFLQNSTPQSKYKFFLTGTGLGDLRDNLLKVEGMMEELKPLLETKSEAMGGLKKNLRELKRERDALRELEHQREYLVNLKLDLLWRIALEKLEDVEDLRRLQQKTEDTLEKINEKINDKDAERAEVKKELDEMGEVLARKSAESDRLNQEKLQAEKEHRRCDREAAGVRNEIRKAQSAVRRAIERRELLRAHIMEARESIEGDTTEEQRMIQEQLHGLRERGAGVEREIENLERRKAAVDRDRHELNERFRVSKDEEEGHAREKRDLQNRLRGLQAGSNDRLSMFGPQLREVVRRIGTDRALRNDPPLGPIGAQVKVSDPKWVVAAEACISKNLELFVASSSQQAERISSIARQARTRISVVTSRVESQVYNIPSNVLPDSRFKRLLDVLEVDDPRIINVLIDHASIERMVLVDNNDDGSAAVRADQRIKFAFEPDGSQHLCKGTSIARWKPGRIEGRLIADQAQFRANLESRLAQVEERWRAVNQTNRQMQTDLDRMRSEISQIDREIRSKLAERSQVSREIRRVEDSQVQAEPPDIAEMERNLEDAEAEIADCEGKVAQYKEDLVKLKEAVEQASVTMAEKMEQLSAHVEEAEKIDAQATALEKAMGQIERAIQKYQGLLDDRRALLANAQADLKNAERDHEELVATARENAPEERRPKATSEVLRATIAATEKDIEKSAKLHRSPDEVDEELLVAVRHFKNCSRELGFLSTIAELVEQMLEKRRIDWVRLLTTDQQRIMNIFSHGMRHRGHSGALEFDSSEEKLHIHVDLQSGMEGEKTRSTSHLETLSGGEKSYTTVALLVAMWDVIDAPVVAVDEFDVFMDEVNRMKAMQLLRQYAEWKTCRQYLFITPQSLKDVKEGPNVKIQRMRPPDRQGGQ